MSQPAVAQPAIEVKGLRKSYGKSVVLDGIDLEIARGTIFALLGPNGAGKTTLINILATLASADAGTAIVAGRDIASDGAGVRRSISLTGQFAAVDPVLSGEENLRMMARLAGLSRSQSRSRTKSLLAQFDLEAEAHKRVKTYSGGLRRRLDIALGLVSTPPVIFLDEPTTGLDTRSRQALWRLILDLAKSGVTIFLTTQYLDEADELADHIAVIDHGQIVAQGTAAELKARVGGDVVELRNANDQIVYEVPTDGSIDGLQRAIEIMGARSRDGEGMRVRIRQPTMDDVFLALTGAPRTKTMAEEFEGVKA